MLTEHLVGILVLGYFVAILLQEIMGDVWPSWNDEANMESLETREDWDARL